ARAFGTPPSPARSAWASSSGSWPHRSQFRGHDRNHRTADLDAAGRLVAARVLQLNVHEAPPAHLRSLFTHDRQPHSAGNQAVAHGEGAQWTTRGTGGRVFADADICVWS